MTSKHFHKLILRKKIIRTRFASTLELDVPDNIKDVFKYKAGQYLTFKTLVAGEELRRSYSINSSAVNNEPLQVTIKKVKNGRVSNYFVDSLLAGDELDVMPPQGQFILPDKIPRKSYFYAAGSGITPIFGLIKTILQADSNSHVNLQYGNLDIEQIIFYNEIEQLESQYAERFAITHHLTNGTKAPQRGLLEKAFGNFKKNKTKKSFEIGDFTAEKLLVICENTDDFLNAEHFICGPGQMIPQLEAALLSVGVAKEKIHHEYFAADNVKKEAEEENLIVTDISGTKKCKLTVTLDGETEVLELPAGETILRASMQQGLDVPYACEAGICATCKALCIKGKVRLRSNSVLSDTELAEGYILTCQAEAVTEELIIDYDVD